MIDLETGYSWIEDFIGVGGEERDNFHFDEEQSAYSISQETYEWWKDIITDNQKIEDHLHELRQEHGNDRIDSLRDEAAWGDLEYRAQAIKDALAQEFGEE